MDIIQRELGSLHDVAGVIGSFIVSSDGELVARELPAMFDDAALGEAGGRLVRLTDALSGGGDDGAACVLRFADHKIVLKSTGAHRLAVVTDANTNLAQLRMAMNLVVRRLGRVDLSTSHPPVVAARTPEAPPVLPTPPVEAIEAAGDDRPSTIPPPTRPASPRGAQRASAAAPEAPDPNGGRSQRPVYFRGKRVR